MSTTIDKESTPNSDCSNNHVRNENAGRGSSVAQRFMSLFRGLERAFGQYIVPKGAKADERGKIKGAASTWDRQPLQLTDWEAHLAGERGLGICPLRDDDTCFFGAIDIDLYPIDHREIIAFCEKHNLPLVLCRSKSGGIHAYVFLSDPVPAKLLRERLRVWARLIGHVGAELFPAQDTMNEKACGNWINMPYFGGAESLRYAYGPEGALSIDDFLDYAEYKRVTKQWLEEWQAPAPEAPSDDWIGAPPCLQAIAEAGGFTAGSRNNGMFALAIYLKRRHAAPLWRDEARRYNQTYFDPPLRGDEMRQILNSVARKDYEYMCDKHPIANYCNRAVCLTRQFGVGRGKDNDGYGDKVTIGRLQRLVADPPLWRIEVNGLPIEMGTEDLLTQSRFRPLVAEHTKKLPPSLKHEVWEALVQKWLDDCEDIVSDDNATRAGRIRFYLSEFCTSRAQAKAKDGVLMGQIWTDDTEERCYFVLTDFVEFLRQRRELVAMNKIELSLLDIGGEPHLETIRGRKMPLWSIPKPSVQTEPFKVHRIDPEEPF